MVRVFVVSTFVFVFRCFSVRVQVRPFVTATSFPAEILHPVPFTDHEGV
jgi:hypothetical protein